MKKYSKILLIAVIIISLFGTLMIYSSSYVWAEYKFNDPYKYLKSQSQIDSSTNKPTSDTDIAYTLDAKAYAYCTGTITATGTKPTFGRTIAVDPKVIPLGTILHDSTGKQYVAEDTGSAINGYRIDIFTGNHQEAKELGVKEIELYW